MAAQEGGEDPWAVEGEVGTSLTFGASDQSVVLLRSGAEHESDRVVFAGEAGFEYGEARASDESSFITGSEFVVDGGITAAYVTPN